jgi:aldehyde dehydrogenase (NAD+)
MQETATISSNAARAAPAEARAEWTADRRLLIDGQLLETGRTVPTINPGAVLGHALVSGAAS